MIVKLINKLITHPRDRVKDGKAGDYGIRVLLHIPAGFLIGLGLLSNDLFLTYQRNEDHHTADQAWKDIAGAMIGYVPGRIARYIIILWFILVLLRFFG